MIGFGICDAVFPRRNLGDNPIASIWSGAFATFQSLEDLILEQTRFSTIPTAGLHTVQILKLNGNTEATVFPDIKHFPKLRYAKLNYPYHCCMWREYIPTSTGPADDVQSAGLYFPQYSNDVGGFHGENRKKREAHYQYGFSDDGASSGRVRFFSFFIYPYLTDR